MISTLTRASLKGLSKSDLKKVLLTVAESAAADRAAREAADLAREEQLRDVTSEARIWRRRALLAEDALDAMRVVLRGHPRREMPLAPLSHIITGA